MVRNLMVFDPNDFVMDFYPKKSKEQPVEQPSERVCYVIREQDCDVQVEIIPRRSE